ncbi:CBU_0592 family membrane protein [Sphingomonas agri]|uniref:CBU_0592 family membrane protein n=1 Tax=Sphingomonas agri TaxID=1813878 RepID=UPI00311E3C87
MTPIQVAVEVAGWIGAALILFAYLLVTIGRLTGQSLAFQWMNLLGALGFVINGWWHQALPSASLNVIWMLIAAVALWRLWKRKGSSTSVM